MKTLYALAVFLGACLLFQVQLILGRIILPWFGGTAGVWIVCLMFFQTALLLGYLYSHSLVRWVRRNLQVWTHGLLLAISLVFLPVYPSEAWKLVGDGSPEWRILALLSVTVGLPFLLLASTSPLLQVWYAHRHAGVSPYWLFSLSNAGSLLGLLSYPAWIERQFGVRMQSFIWSGAYLAFCLIVLFLLIKERPQAAKPAEAQEATPSSQPRVLWVILSACGSALLLSVTNTLTQNVAPMPLLWVLPLIAYLVSFIVCFGRASWYRRDIFLPLVGVALGSMAYALEPDFSNASLLLLVPLFTIGLFICCMACHGELARHKPPVEDLTAFYLMVALGGAIGGVYVGLVAPNIFGGYFELATALGACALTVLLSLRRDAALAIDRSRWHPMWLAGWALSLLLVGYLTYTQWDESRSARIQRRNFYGQLRVVELAGPGGGANSDTDRVADYREDRRARKLVHGTIDHGVQFLPPGRRSEPTSYYGPQSGVGLALKAAMNRYDLRVGVVGLGIGTLAAYGRVGDRYTFYEINPLVIELARTEFFFLQDSEAAIEVVIGDARISLEREAPREFDVLVVDAFSSDSIPVHLLTREAFDLYLRHLKTEGLLAMHISNQFLDLEPVVAAAADAEGLQAVIVDSGRDYGRQIYAATWVVLTRSKDALVGADLQSRGRPLRRVSGFRPWTDDYSNLLHILKLPEWNR